MGLDRFPTFSYIVRMKKRTTITVEVTAQVKREYARRAKEAHLKLSDMVRKALYSHLEEQSKGQAA